MPLVYFGLTVDREAIVAGSRLGELESAIMQCVWQLDRQVTVPEVHAHLLRSRQLAYTSTMTVMSRLFEKGLLARSEERRPYTYWAKTSREDYSSELMLQVLAEFRDREAVLTRFVERIGAKDARLLADLVSKARRRRT